MTLSPAQQYYLQTLGVDIYIDRNSRELPLVAAKPDSVTPKRRIVETGKNAIWAELEKRVAGCTLCDLHKTRTQTVFGVGDHSADWLIIGEAPGRDEDRQGQPFVGRAGKLLNAMLHAVGLEREQVFIANILKCRPPNNRDPNPEEVRCCEPYLKQQIELVQPKIIVALGRVAAQNLLKVDTPIGRMRGRQYEYPGPRVPVVVTYHPAYLLRSPREKRKSWQDLQLAMKIYQASR